MTKERAQELLDLAYSRRFEVPWAPGQAPLTSRGGYICSTHPELHEDSRGMTREEEKEVKKFWETLPGDTCFLDALARLAE